ncbi:MAG: hypothetical protein JNL57_04705 [Bacteroidetes bacterium]|nr:hypothetical protein [Bacteroidota bacterium]
MIFSETAKHIGIITFIGVLVTFIACRKTPDPVADFALNTLNPKEGEVVLCTQRSKNASQYEWRTDNGSFSSNEAQPAIHFDLPGSCKLTLTVKNKDGKAAVKSVDVVVLPDTIWRLSNNDKKVWHIRSIVYAGNELLTEDCQNDDEFICYKTGADTFQITEGSKKCPDGSYPFAMPGSGQWKFDTKKRALQFALVAFGSPINLSFASTKCSRDSFIGYDSVNDVYLKMVRK